MQYAIFLHKRTYMVFTIGAHFAVGMGIYFHLTLYWVCYFLSMLGLKIIRISNMGPCLNPTRCRYIAIWSTTQTRMRKTMEELDAHQTKQQNIRIQPSPKVSNATVHEFISCFVFHDIQRRKNVSLKYSATALSYRAKPDIRSVMKDAAVHYSWHVSWIDINRSTLEHTLNKYEMIAPPPIHLNDDKTFLFTILTHIKP